MSSAENTEVYIPKDACVSKIPVQCLPVSIARKMGIRPSTSDLEKSANGSCHLATWICPVELREKRTPALKTSQTHRFLTQGCFNLPLLSSNPTASRLLKNFLASSKSTTQGGEPDITVSCSRVSSSRQNAVILYDGQIFLSLRKKFLRSGQSDSKNLVSPVPAAQKDQLKALNLPSSSAGMQLGELNSVQKRALLCPQVSSHTVKQPQEQHECGAAAEFCSGSDPMHRIVDHTEKQPSETSDSWPDEGIRDTTHARKSKRGDDQTDNDGGNEEEPMGRETGFSSNEQHEKNSDVSVHFNSEPMENVSEGGMQVDGQLDGVDDDQRFRDKPYVEDVNMNKINETDLNVASKNISIGDKLLEDMENEAEVENKADSCITLEAVEGCKINGYSLPAKAQGSEFHTFPVISHVTSLAKGWDGDVGVMNDGSLCSSSEKTNPEISTPSRTVEGQAPLLEASLQENGEELLLPCLNLPLENHRLDFKELEQLEKIGRIRNALRKMEAKLEMVNWKK